MTTADESRDPAAWSAERQRWYASLVAHCNGFNNTHGVPAVISAVREKPPSKCLFMAGDAVLDDRVEDSEGRLWSTDQHGRWFATVDRKILWLQHELVRIGCGQLPHDGRVVSHLCGNCGCICMGHLRLQTKSEDALDKAYHRAHGAGTFRPRERVPKSPVTEPNPVRKTKRVRSPCHE